jgi:enoyl-CoA hydratase/carnithine racemase
MTGRVTVRIADAVASVELDNPAQRNAISKAMCLEMLALMPLLDADPAVTVITLRGAGDVFSAGAQLNDLSSILMDGEPGHRTDHLSRADDAITSVSKPTIALVDGACMGGGWQLASACDFIVASERSTFAITPAKLGIIYPRPGIERLVREVGPATAKLILFTGLTFTAERAQAMGLVAEIYPEAEFHERCEGLIDALRVHSGFSIHHLKRLVNLTVGTDTGLDEAWNHAWHAMEHNPDLPIGVDAFLAHQLPRFTWTPT